MDAPPAPAPPGYGTFHDDVLDEHGNRQPPPDPDHSWVAAWLRYKKWLERDTTREEQTDE